MAVGERTGVGVMVMVAVGVEVALGCSVGAVVAVAAGVILAGGSVGLSAIGLALATPEQAALDRVIITHTQRSDFEKGSCIRVFSMPAEAYYRWSTQAGRLQSC